MKTLSDFYNMKVLRHGKEADVVCDWAFTTDEYLMPVKLYGFDASKTDNEIREDAFQYYKKLLEEVNKNK